MTPTPLDAKPQGAQLKKRFLDWAESKDIDLDWNEREDLREAAERIEKLERDYDTAMKTNNHQAQIIRDLRGEKGKLRHERDTALRALAEVREALNWMANCPQSDCAACRRKATEVIEKQLHAGDTISLSNELDEWKERAQEAERALAEARRDAERYRALKEMPDRKVDWWTCHLPCDQDAFVDKWIASRNAARQPEKDANNG